MDVAETLRRALQDRYRLERELGQGGMATVYLAEDLKHHRQVALKVLRPEIAATVGAGSFAREIEVAARLQHPNILPLLDSGEVEGFFFYVMPYVEGESLRDRLARGGELPIQDAVRILMEVADALSHAHAHGVVHRDIKPDNVMLSGRHALVEFALGRCHQQLPVDDFVALAVLGEGADHLGGVVDRRCHTHKVGSAVEEPQEWATCHDGCGVAGADNRNHAGRGVRLRSRVECERIRRLSCFAATACVGPRYWPCCPPSRRLAHSHRVLVPWTSPRRSVELFKTATASSASWGKAGWRRCTSPKI